METRTLRLKTGQDLKIEIDRVVNDEGIEAAFIITCVGSLRTAVLRFANQKEEQSLLGHFDIFSLTGVMSKHGSHYHIGISDERGYCYGAHLLEGCKIYTTAEIVIGIISDCSYLRTMDPQTGDPELEVVPLTEQKN